MSKPSLKVLSFKERVSEKIAQFIDDPLSLRDLAYARYRRFRGDSVYHSADYHRKRSERLKAEHFSRKHKKHVMHAQHRTNCVNVFKLLVLRLDLNTLECLLVAPRYNVRRPLYVVEIAQRCGICVRTAQHCLRSLALAGYIRRFEDMASKRVDKDNTLQNLHRIFLNPRFFADIECDASFNRLRDYLKGITKKEARTASTQADVSAPTDYRSAILEDEKNKSEQADVSAPTDYRSAILADEKNKSEKQSTEPASKEYGNSHIQKMRRRRSGSEPPD